MFRKICCIFIISVFGIAADIILNIDVSGPQQDSSSGWCDVKKSRRSQSWLLILNCRESYAKILVRSFGFLMSVKKRLIKVQGNYFIKVFHLLIFSFVNIFIKAML